MKINRYSLSSIGVMFLDEIVDLRSNVYFGYTLVHPIINLPGYTLNNSLEQLIRGINNANKN